MQSSQPGAENGNTVLQGYIVCSFLLFILLPQTQGFWHLGFFTCAIEDKSEAVGQLLMEEGLALGS